MLKCQGLFLYGIYWSLWGQLSYKGSLLVICKISRLFINTLSAHGKYSLFNRDNLTQQIQMQLSRKQKTFSDFFAAISKSNLNFECLKKKWLWELRSFRNCRLRKTWLHQCLKTLVSRDRSESNMANAPKHCWKFHGSTFTIFIDHCQCNSLAKMDC